MKIELRGQLPPLDLGETPYGRRRVVPIIGGSFSGDRLSGTVLNFGADWALIRRDGVFDADVRAMLFTSDGVHISFCYSGRVHAPSGNLASILRREGNTVDLYYRMSAKFECASNCRHNWLNDIVTVMRGEPTGIGSNYDVFEVL